MQLNLKLENYTAFLIRIRTDETEKSCAIKNGNTILNDKAYYLYLKALSFKLIAKSMVQYLTEIKKTYKKSLLPFGCKKTFVH